MALDVTALNDFNNQLAGKPLFNLTNNSKN